MSAKKKRITYNGHETSEREDRAADGSLNFLKDTHQEESFSWAQGVNPMKDNEGLFTDSQKRELIRNGSSNNSGKNHVPVCFFQMKKLGYSILVTELRDNSGEVCFGLTDHDEQIMFKEFSLAEIKRQMLSEDALFSTNLDFVGKYPIAVYAKVAERAGFVVGYSNDPLMSSFFEKFAADIWNKKSALIEDLKPLG